jgi:hypothetical protein
MPQPLKRRNNGLINAGFFLVDKGLQLIKSNLTFKSLQKIISTKTLLTGPGYMTEKLLHYIWQFQQFNKTDLVTIDGEKIEIIFPGSLNKDQGPDFSDAKIKIGNTLFAGSVELHLHTSDWNKHHHQQDSNYKNVILHVVFTNDLSQNHDLPVLELEHRIPKLVLEKYVRFMEAVSFIPCETSITQVKDIIWTSWKERLIAERLTRKAQVILWLLKETTGHWEETFWWLLAGTFGMKVNREAFESLARTVPVNLFAKHKNSIHQLEAFLLGQAGLLKQTFNEDYPQLLQREYRFLQKKYNLKPSYVPVHFLRMRPQNFPTVRLAQLAMLIHQSDHLFSKVLETDDLKKVRQWLSVTASDYWHYHYRLDEPSVYNKKSLGADMIDTIIINTLVPVLFAYGLHKNEEPYKLKALHWLENTVAEKNTITNGFSKNNIVHTNAYDTQALIELKNEYCSGKRCLECSVGNFLLKGDHSTSSS